jgi:3-(3-hydroxy-phenyl)propionate hydroxylase
VRDAHNLCWKVAAVVQGDADPALLDSYEPERKPNVRKVTDKAVFFGRVITERRRVQTVARNLFFRVAMRSPVVGPYFREGKWFPAPDYRGGLAACRRKNGVVGQRVPQPFVATPDESHIRMDDALGHRWSIVSRTPREAGTWAELGAAVHVLGDDILLDEFMGDADAIVLRPDMFVYGAVGRQAPLPPPPAVFTANRKAVSA